MYVYVCVYICIYAVICARHSKLDVADNNCSHDANHPVCSQHGCMHTIAWKDRARLNAFPGSRNPRSFLWDPRKLLHRTHRVFMIHASRVHAHNREDGSYVYQITCRNEVSTCSKHHHCSLYLTHGQQ